MSTCVDIDEKCFYLTQVKATYILVPGKRAHHQACSQKSHIPKVMCLTAIAYPCQDPGTGIWWDWKIGTWFFVELVPAAWGSKTHPCWTLENKTVVHSKELPSKLHFVACQLNAHYYGKNGVMIFFKVQSGLFMYSSREGQKSGGFINPWVYYSWG